MIMITRESVFEIVLISSTITNVIKDLTNFSTDSYNNIFHPVLETAFRHLLAPFRRTLHILIEK